jgi:hypothetical protein
MMRSILVLLFLNYCLVVNGQNTGGNPTLVNFTAQRAGNNVRVDWTIRLGFSCTSVYVMYSTDSINYVPIFQYPGICGATTQDESYTFTHTTPSSGNNYYKMNLGNFGVSGIIPVFMVMYGNDGLSITTSAENKHEVYFNNPANTSFTVELFSLDGKLKYRREGIEDDHFAIPAIPGNSEAILIRLIGVDGKVYLGKYFNLN